MAAAFRPFRFGVVLNDAADAASWRAAARRVEQLGFHTLVMGDHLGDRFSPVPALVAAASATTVLRVGTTVFCNGWRNPVMLAKELATVDVLTEGRLEVGVGSGWRKEGFDALGLTFEAPAIRVGRLEEAVQIVKGVWTERPFEFSGSYYRVGPVSEGPVPMQRPHPPLLLGVGGPRSLRIAGRFADIVNLTPSTRADGGGIDPTDATLEAFRRKVEQLDEATEDRPPPERSVMVMGLAVDEDVHVVASRIGWSIGEHVEALLGGPTFLAGSATTIADDLEFCRSELGISYFVILEHAVEAFLPVLEALAGQAAER